MKVFGSWWKRLLRKKGVKPARIIVIGHNITDARRWCPQLDVSPSCARSAGSVDHLRGCSRDITFYVTPYCRTSAYSDELHDMMMVHAGGGGTVVWIPEEHGWGRTSERLLGEMVCGVREFGEEEEMSEREIASLTDHFWPNGALPCEVEVQEAPISVSPGWYDIVIQGQICKCIEGRESAERSATALRCALIARSMPSTRRWFEFWEVGH